MTLFWFSTARNSPRVGRLGSVLSFLRCVMRKPRKGRVASGSVFRDYFPTNLLTIVHYLEHVHPAPRRVDRPVVAAILAHRRHVQPGPRRPARPARSP